MAIDTTSKRFSFVGFGSPIPAFLFVPDSAPDASDLADMLYLYSGITLDSDVAVPNIVGLSESAADTALTDAGLVSGTVTYANSDAVASGLVISQDPAAGSNVTTGSSVDYVVSLGAADAALTGGGKGAKQYARRRKYPRRVMVDGVLYVVNSPMEEASLLARLLAEKQEEAQAIEADAGTVPARKRAVIRRIENRLENVADEVDAWRAQLEAWDAQILPLLLH